MYSLMHFHIHFHPKTPNQNQTKEITKMLKQLFIILITTQLIMISNPTLVSSWTPFPKRYWVNIENGLSKDAMDLHCQMVHRVNYDEDLGLVHIPVNGYFNHTFRTLFMKKTYCRCNLTWPNRGRLNNFDAFEDDLGFVEFSCGGRRCTWRPTDDGIYLFNLKKGRFVKGGDWDKF
ncbi:hypothetical protein RND81_05G216200 [Saponaria officinalis]|uniref:S-protein homolog n=1 Tax=Saponaria officinalis TaxID=3572 RepID=A0AAW1KVK4_SAPOF